MKVIIHWAIERKNEWEDQFRPSDCHGTDFVGTHKPETGSYDCDFMPYLLFISPPKYANHFHSGDIEQGVPGGKGSCKMPLQFFTFQRSKPQHTHRGTLRRKWRKKERKTTKKNYMPKGNKQSSVPLPLCFLFVCFFRNFSCKQGSGSEGGDVFVILL